MSQLCAFRSPASKGFLCQQHPGSVDSRMILLKHSLCSAGRQLLPAAGSQVRAHGSLAPEHVRVEVHVGESGGLNTAVALEESTFQRKFPSLVLEHSRSSWSGIPPVHFSRNSRWERNPSAARDRRSRRKCPRFPFRSPSVLGPRYLQADSWRQAARASARGGDIRRILGATGSGPAPRTGSPKECKQ